MTAAAPHTGPDLAKTPGPPAVSKPPAGRRTLRRFLPRFLPLTPALALLLVFLAGPIAYCVLIAFTDLQLTGQARESFVGLDNFRRAFRDDAFLNAVWLTLVFTVVSALVGQNTLGLALAALMQRASKPVRTLTGGVVVTAWVLPEVVAGFLLYAFFRREGTLNAVLGLLHLPSQNWLSPCRSWRCRSPTCGAARRSRCWCTPPRSTRSRRRSPRPPRWTGRADGAGCGTSRCR